MARRNRAEVLVVGAGPVGQLAALALAKRGLRVRVVDEEKRRAAHSYALALHPESLTLLSELGLQPTRFEDSLAVNTIAFYDGAARRAEIRLGELPNEWPYLMVLRQSHFEEVLEKALRDAGVKVEWNRRFIGLLPGDDGLEVELGDLDKVTTGYPMAWGEWEVVKTRREKVDFVIGADGHRSLVRKSLGIGFEVREEPQYFAVFEFNADFLCDETRIMLEYDTTNVLWPLPDGRYRFSFQLLSPPEEFGDSRQKSRLAVTIASEAYPFLTDDVLHRLIRERAPWFDGTPGEITWSVMARFERRLVQRFGDDRTWLAGDAAHLTGPVGVQSMNVGLREAVDLADRLTAVHEGQEPVASLAGYGRTWAREWRRLLGVDRRFDPGQDTDEWIVRNRDRILPCLPGSGADLELQARHLGLRSPTPQDEPASR